MDVRPDVDLIISNQFGKIELIATDKNNISGIIEIVVSAKNAEKINELLGSIKVDEKADNQRVIFNTTLSKGMKWNGTGKSAIGDKNFEINYKLFVPVGARVTVNNKFGEGVFTGFSNFMDLNFEYGGIVLTRMPQADCRLKVTFGRLNAQEVGTLYATTKYSNADVENVGKLQLNASFNNVYVRNVSRELEVSASYGNVEVDDISESVKGVSIRNSFGNVDLTLPSKLSTRVKLSNKFGKTRFKTPDGKFSSSSGGSGSSEEYGFTIGDEASAIPVSISTSYGNLNLRFR